MTNTEVYQAYYHVINHEMKLTKGRYTAPLSSAREILGITEQLRCIVESATVLRACATRYGLTKDEIAYESVSAHTNLVQAIVDRALAHHYGPYFDKTEDGYTYREIMETIRRHDLPENIIGDIPDNGNRDDKKLTYDEHLYWREFAGESPSRESMFERQVERLQKEMEERSGFCGQLLYVADKISAILMVL